ncbi:MAG: flavin reductase family protein [Candidatus Lokiarchaeota archaeon]|nr:flavin reductase family protein [Candidatus Lokiarchaeota archaeon]
MTKNKIRLSSYLFPRPVVLIGANINGKPNFEPLAYISSIEDKPPLISIASYENHYTNIGIKENGTFSVNTPSEEIIEGTDYCGIVSGKEADKSEVFEVFYGELKTAPMISKAPLNLECKVIKTIVIKDLTGAEKGHELFIGEVVNSYAEDEYLTEGAPDIFKINTFTYSMKQYWKVGEQVAKAWEIGKKYMKDK